MKPKKKHNLYARALLFAKVCKNNEKHILCLWTRSVAYFLGRTREYVCVQSLITPRECMCVWEWVCMCMKGAKLEGSPAQNTLTCQKVLRCGFNHTHIHTHTHTHHTLLHTQGGKLQLCENGILDRPTITGNNKSGKNCHKRQPESIGAIEILYFCGSMESILKTNNDCCSAITATAYRTIYQKLSSRQSEADNRTCFGQVPCHSIRLLQIIFNQSRLGRGTWQQLAKSCHSNFHNSVNICLYYYGIILVLLWYYYGIIIKYWMIHF